MNEYEQRKKTAITKLFLAFQGGGSAEKVAAYLEALSRIAPSFVEAACSAAGRGKIGNPTFLPSAAEICRFAEDLQAKTIKASKEDQRPWVKVPDPPREFLVLDPAAETFSPFKLGLTQEQITKCVLAYSRGEDWLLSYHQAAQHNKR